jgi:hypothetical protein
MASKRTIVTNIVLRTGGQGSIPTGTQEAFTDLAAYPILTEELGYAPSPAGLPSGGTSGSGTSQLAQISMKAVADVLGWKPKGGDVKGFLGALNASFTGREVDGQTEYDWTPRTYAVQTDLAGGISGAQASLYSRAQDSVNQAIPLVDGLYALRIDADPQDVQALKAIVKSQMTELVGELGMLGGPRISRVNQYFLMLLGITIPVAANTSTEPDAIPSSCTLGTLRDELGLWSVYAPKTPFSSVANQPLINTVEEEQNVTNFRLVVDYMTSLALSWNNNQQFFGLATATPFFGTQLVVLARQLAVANDSVDEVRFTMDSVFITPSERQTMEIDFPAAVGLPRHPPIRPAAIPPGAMPPPQPLNNTMVGSQPMFMEDLLSWVQRFASEEGPRLIQEGGKYAVNTSVLPVVTNLRNLVLAAQRPTNLADLPKGYRSPRVQRALQNLASQLDELAFLSNPIKHTIPSQR